MNCCFSRLKKFLILSMAIILPCFFFSLGSEKAYSSTKWTTQSVKGEIYGTYKILGSSGSYTFDVDGGLEAKNSVKILAYESLHNSANQKFNIEVCGANGSDYVYYIRPSYTLKYFLDVSGGVSSDGANLQIYKTNGTQAQKFVFKEVYDSQGLYKGYMIFTGSSNFEKCLAKQNGYVVQQSVNYNNVSQNQIWTLNKVFDTYYTVESGYSNYEMLNGAEDTEAEKIKYWNALFDPISLNISFDQSKTSRIGYNNNLLFKDSLTIGVSQDEKIKDEGKASYNNFELVKDESTTARGRYAKGELGKGTIEVDFVDESRSDFYRNVMSSNKKQTLSFGSNQKLTFNKPGNYAIRVYYKVKSKTFWFISSEVFYVMKEFRFTIVDSSSEAVVLKTENGQANVSQGNNLAKYVLSVDSSNNISVKYDGLDSYKANTQDVIDYVSGAYNETTESAKTQRVAELVQMVKKYKTYTVVFTNISFKLKSVSGEYVQIAELVQGYNSTNGDNHVQFQYRQEASAHVTNGIYTYISKNDVSDDVCYFKVYLQKEPHKQVFRNCSYVVYDSDYGAYVNYAMDYAFMEIVKTFPYTMVTSVYYENITNENKHQRFEYQSNKLIYNTTEDLLKLKFHIYDISGNVSNLYLFILPPIAPSYNHDALMKNSYKFNYNSTGYPAYLYNNQTKKYDLHLFSSEKIAYDQIFANIFSNSEMYSANALVHTLNYNPLGKSQPKEFKSNEEVVSQIYKTCEDFVKLTTITNFNDYIIEEQQMYSEQLYLTKEFYFDDFRNTDKFLANPETQMFALFPLFETYKIKYTYTSDDGELLKSGYITVDYGYCVSMFELLADKKEKNWKSGTVEFVEYNICPGLSTSYTARIVNSMSPIQIKLKQNNKIKTMLSTDTANNDCSSFSLSPINNDKLTIRVARPDFENMYDETTIQDVVFTEYGTYVITVRNRFGFGYTFSIKIENLDKYFTGVTNFGESSNSVVMSMPTNDFECYINGKKQTLDLQKENGTYNYTFQKQSLEQNVVIKCGSMVFAFKINGSEKLDLDVYNYYNNTDEDLVKIKSSYSNDIEEMKKAKTLHDEIEKINQTLRNINPNKFNESRLTLKKANESIERLEVKVDNFSGTDNNPLLRLNSNYFDSSYLKSELQTLKLNYKATKQSFDNSAVEYLKNAGIKHMTKEIYDQLEDYTFNEIMELYNASLNDIKALNIEKISGYISQINVRLASYEELSIKVKNTNSIADCKLYLSQIEEYENQNAKLLVELKQNIKSFNEIELTKNPFFDRDIVLSGLDTLSEKCVALEYVNVESLYTFIESYIYQSYKTKYETNKKSVDTLILNINTQDNAYNSFEDSWFVKDIINNIKKSRIKEKINNYQAELITVNSHSKSQLFEINNISSDYEFKTESMKNLIQNYQKLIRDSETVINFAEKYN